MSHGWNGPDPTQAADSSSYELGVEFVANAAVTVSAVRVWEGASPSDFPSRRGRLWSTAGALLGSAAMPTTLPPGWSEYTLDSPVDLTLGEHVVVSYSTGGNYGVVNHALDSGVVSADGLVTAAAAASGAHGNGAFITVPTSFPDHASPQNTFYGVDIVYTATGGNTPPTIVGMTVIADGLSVTSTINATDNETLAGATYSWNWGDGSNSSGLSSNTATHTYIAGGTYAVLGSVTDSGGLSAYAARPVTLVAAAAGFDPLGLINAVASIVLGSGLFTAVSSHEPASLPATGMAAAVWMQGIGPLKKLSGLAGTAARVELRLRIYTPLITGNMDSIDPSMTSAASEMIRRLSADFTLNGEIFAADLLGAQGNPLSAKADYYKQGDQFYRIYDITVPLLVDDVWAQAPAGAA